MTLLGGILIWGLVTVSVVFIAVEIVYLRVKRKLKNLDKEVSEALKNDNREWF